MRDLTTLDHHPVVKDITDLLCDKTQNTDRSFYNMLVSFFLGKIASSMRASVQTKDRGDIPVNVYAMCLAPSGFGKGHSVNIMESRLCAGFRKRFMDGTFPQVSEDHIFKLATERSVMKGTTQEKEKTLLDKEFGYAGTYPFTFDSGTTPAVKQLRQKLLLSSAGAINLQIDEIGSNLLGNQEVLVTFLELFDLGITKQKLTKNTVDNTRGENVDGRTPTNMLLFGTPSKLLDGGNTEDMFFEFLETGYARRCLFAWGNKTRSASVGISAEEIYSRLISEENADLERKYRDHFARLADPLKHRWSMEMPDDVAIELIKYRTFCESIADELPEHREIEKAELSHRYFKVLKLAGIYSFIDELPEVTMDNLYHAICMAEESGESFQKLLNRDKNYVKLAKYIAGSDGELTHADLHEALPYYGKATRDRNEIMTLASAWGYKNNIIITKQYSEGIDFFSGSALEETDLDNVIFSYSTDFAKNYELIRGPFELFDELTSLDGYHWCNHGFKNEHRRSENAIPGFNLLVLDIDGTANREFVHEVLQDYVFMTQTTKRHTEEEHRFRLIMPIKYELLLDKDDYQQFMNNIMEWLPFNVDEAANQRERKWLTNPNGVVHFNLDAAILDPIKFVPRTTKNDTHQRRMTELQDYDQLEKWFAERMLQGNRNNTMIRFALALADTGMDYNEIQQRVLDFNSKIPQSLSENEINETIFRTVSKRLME